ncbi:MAG: hypothetical protein ACRCT8_12120 [Lacipirellulaceae bacterium]
MARGKTGQGMSFALSASGFTQTIIEATPPAFDGSSVDLPRLNVAANTVVAKGTGDQVDAGAFLVEIEHDPGYVPPFYVVQDAILTYPVPQGLTNGAVETFVGAFVSGWTPGALQRNGRRQATLRVEVQSFPTKTPAS